MPRISGVGGPYRVDLQNPVADHPLNWGLVSWWLPLPHLFGGGVLRGLRNLHHGAISGATWGAAPGGFGSLVFASANDVVTCGNHAALQLASTVSLGVYFIANSWNAGYDYLAGKEQAASPYSNYLLRNESSQFQWVNGIGGSESKLTATLPSTGAWHLAVGTYDGATKSLYVDGVQVASTSVSGSLLNASADMTIGDGIGWTGRSLRNGKIGSVWLWNRALSAAEVRGLNTEVLRGYPAILNRYPERAWFILRENAAATSFVPYPRPRGLDAGMSVMSGGLC